MRVAIVGGGPRGRLLQLGVGPRPVGEGERGPGAEGPGAASDDAVDRGGSHVAHASIVLAITPGIKT